jgi:hypothetical protein
MSSTPGLISTLAWTLSMWISVPMVVFRTVQEHGREPRLVLGIATNPLTQGLQRYGTVYSQPPAPVRCHHRCNHRPHTISGTYSQYIAGTGQIRVHALHYYCCYCYICHGVNQPSIPAFLSPVAYVFRAVSISCPWPPPDEQAHSPT